MAIFYSNFFWVYNQMNMKSDVSGSFFWYYNHKTITSIALMTKISLHWKKRLRWHRHINAFFCLKTVVDQKSLHLGWMISTRFTTNWRSFKKVTCPSKSILKIFSWPQAPLTFCEGGSAYDHQRLKVFFKSIKEASRRQKSNGIESLHRNLYLWKNLSTSVLIYHPRKVLNYYPWDVYERGQMKLVNSFSKLQYVFIMKLWQRMVLLNCYLWGLFSENVHYWTWHLCTILVKHVIFLSRIYRFIQSNWFFWFW